MVLGRTPVVSAEQALAVIRQLDPRRTPAVPCCQLQRPPSDGPPTSPPTPRPEYLSKKRVINAGQQATSSPREISHHARTEVAGGRFQWRGSRRNPPHKTSLFSKQCVPCLHQVVLNRRTCVVLRHG